MAPVLYDVKPQLGDLIEIDRPLYQHWAIYVGNNYVIHLAPPSEVAGVGSASVMSVVCDRAIVKKEELWSVVGHNEWRINNILDDKYESRPVHDIVKEALELEGRVLQYSVLTNNCEHFVTELRYGKPESRQVRQAGQAAAATLGIFGIAALGLYLLSGGRKEKRNDQ